MNNKTHVHIEASIVSLLILVLIGFIDSFVDFFDGHAYKTFGYIALYFVFYVIATVIFKKIWSR